MAEEAIEGAGGKMATFQVACRCRAFGISEDRTLDLMRICSTDARSTDRTSSLSMSAVILPRLDDVGAIELVGHHLARGFLSRLL